MTSSNWIDLTQNNFFKDKETFLNLFINESIVDDIDAFVDIKEKMPTLYDFILQHGILGNGQIMIFDHETCGLYYFDNYIHKLYNIVNVDDEYEYKFVICQEFERIFDDIYIKYKDFIDYCVNNNNNSALILNIDSLFIKNELNISLSQENIDYDIYITRFKIMKNVLFHYTGYMEWCVYIDDMNDKLIIDNNELHHFMILTEKIHDICVPHVCYIVKTIFKYDIIEDMIEYIIDAILFDIRNIQDTYFISKKLIDTSTNNIHDTYYISIAFSIPLYKEIQGVQNIKSYFRDYITTTRFLRICEMDNRNSMKYNALIDSTMNKVLVSVNNYDSINDRYIPHSDIL